MKWPSLFRKSKRERDLTAQLTDYRNRLNAKYDSAGTSEELESYWANTDHRSPKHSTDYDTRRKVRSRARYEAYESNTVAKRIMNAKANDVVGAIAPILQVNTPDRDLNQTIERRFKEYSDQIQLVRKLRQLYQAKLVDGEAFAERITNPIYPDDGPQTDLLVSEADLWTNGFGSEKENEADGILFDGAGNPRTYNRLVEHPGDQILFHGALDADTLKAPNVIHWFRADRPGQLRGMSEFVAALPLFAELRRYRFAVLTAAETAANYSAVVFSDVPAFAQNPDTILKTVKTLPIYRRMMTRLPAGWRMEQLKAEQPTADFDQLCNSIYQEIGGATRTPLNIVIGSSKDYNFSSGKMDYQLYYDGNDEEREDMRLIVLETVFDWWFEESLMIPGYLPSLGEFTRFNLPHRWIFKSRPPIDELKAAQADQVRFNIGHLTDEDFAFREGMDPEEFQEKLARSNASRQELGSPIPERFGFMLWQEQVKANLEEQERNKEDVDTGTTDEAEAATADD